MKPLHVAKRPPAPPPTVAIELWTVDEHRLGLKLPRRGGWPRVVQSPIVPVPPCYEWLSVYAVAQPRTGQTSGCRHPQSP
jgi:hypothetical protein